jgi:hypothetical protein
MFFLIFLLPFLIFLFTLYKLSRDDHVFLRRNVRLENFFDITFLMVIASWILTQIMSAKNVYSLTYVVLGGKYRRLPTGRVFDFFTLSFLTALPLWFLFVGLFARREDIIMYAIIAGVYLLLDITFLKVLKPRIMNRSLPDGVISFYFIMIFSLLSLGQLIFSAIKGKLSLVNPENISLLILLIAGSALYFLRKR